MHGLRVLLVEDNVINQKVAVRMLERAEMLVDHAENGAEAVALAENGNYDIVLMDCQMPVMDGFSATRAIRSAERSSGERVPIIAMTANAFEGDREGCMTAGMDDYLSKPVTFARLVDKLIPWAIKARSSAP